MFAVFAGAFDDSLVAVDLGPELASHPLAGVDAKPGAVDVVRSAFKLLCHGVVLVSDLQAFVKKLVRLDLSRTRVLRHDLWHG